MNLVGKVIGNRYEILEKLVKVVWPQYTKPDVIF